MTATQPRQFHIGDVLSVATGKLLSPRHIDGIYDLCNYMTGDDLFTHQLPRASKECEPALREQHPKLTAVPIPEIRSREDLDAWLATLYPTFGETVAVDPLPAGAHTFIAPIAELTQMLSTPPVDERREAIAFRLFAHESGQDEEFIRRVWEGYPDDHGVKQLYLGHADALLNDEALDLRPHRKTAPFSAAGHRPTESESRA